MKWTKRILISGIIAIVTPFVLIALFMLFEVTFAQWFDGYTPPKNIYCSKDSDCSQVSCKNMGRFKPCGRDGESRCNEKKAVCECLMACI